MSVGKTEELGAIADRKQNGAFKTIGPDNDQAAAQSLHKGT